MGAHSGFPFQNCAQFCSFRQNLPRSWFKSGKVALFFFFALRAERLSEVHIGLAGF